MNNKAIKYITFISGLSIKAVVSVYICIILGNVLKDTFNLGNWIMISSIILGIISLMYTFYEFFIFIMKKESE